MDAKTGAPIYGPRRLRRGPQHPLVDLAPHRAEHVVGHNRAVHARLEVLPQPAPLPRDERRGDGLQQRVDRGPRRVGAHPQRRLVAAHLGLKLEADAALGLDDGAVGREVGVVAAAGERDDRSVNEAGVDLGQPCRVEAEPDRVAGAGALHEHVDPPRQVVEPGAAGRAVEVEDDALLPPVPHGPRRHRPKRIAAGTLGLDHLRAVVGHDHRSQAAGHPFRQIEDAHTFEDRAHAAALGLLALG